MEAEPVGPQEEAGGHVREKRTRRETGSVVAESAFLTQITK